MSTNQTQIIPSFEPTAAQTAISQVEDLKAALVPLEAEAKALKVENASEFEQAGLLLKRVRDNRKQGEWTLKPLKSIADTIKSFLRTTELSHSNKCEEIEGRIAGKMNDYKIRERELAAAEERRINEQRRIEAARAAEAQRKQDELAAAEVRKQREKELAEAARAGEVKKREQARLQKEIEEHERLQREQAAKDAEALKASVQEVKVAPATPKIAGLRQRQNWRYRIVDPTKVPREYLMPDEQKIGQAVRAWKKAGEVIPGIEAYAEDAI
jgi:hypothetical protein